VVLVLFVTFGIYGEYDDYVGLKLTNSELKVIEKFIEEVNSSSNIAIKVINIEKDSK